MTANLQSRFTVKQAAAVMNVSERMIYMARRLRARRAVARPLGAAGQ